MADLFLHLLGTSTKPEQTEKVLKIITANFSQMLYPTITEKHVENDSVIT